MMQRTFLFGTASLCLAISLAPVATAPVAAQEGGAREWHQWRGADRDGHSHETGLLAEWPEGGPRKVIEVGGLGVGYSSFSARGDRLVTMGGRGGREQVLAIDERTGLVLWRVENGPMYENGRGDGPRGTPTIDGDRVFALGGNGRLVSLDLETGDVIWRLDLLRKFGARNIRWGISESPLVVDDLVLVNPGGPGASVVALERDTGEVVWQSGDDRAGYSSAMLVERGGRQQAVFLTASGGLGVDLLTGRQLWSYEPVANSTANAATPIVQDDKVFLSSDYGTGCALLELSADGSSVREVYFNSDMRNHHSSSVLVDGVLYGFSGSILTAMELDSGRVLWKDRSVGKGSLIVADGHLYLFSEKGVVALAEVSPSAYREKARFELPKPAGPTWSHPMIHHGRLVLRDQDTLYVFDVAAAGDAP